MNKQAMVGLFTLFGLVALFALCLFLANIGTGGRYETGVHFKSAAGLHKGALVYESGVIVGVVDQTRLLPEDFTVDIVMGINNGVDIPRDSRFLIAAPLTGDATVEIVPPAPSPRPAGIVGPTPAPPAVSLLPRQVLPIDQQPQGTNPATIGDLLEEGQGEVHRLDGMLSELEVSEPRLLSSLQSALNNANDLTAQGSKRLYRLTDRLETLTMTLQLAMDAGSKNIVDMTGTLDSTVHRNTANVDTMLSMLSKSSIALNQTADQVRDLAANPQVHQNLLDTARGLAQTASNVSQLTQDLRNVTGNAQTQAQLRDTIANTDAATQKLNSLLRSLGGTSSVYGVDPGATPGPAGGSIVGVPNTAGSPAAAGTAPQDFKSRIGAVARDLLAFQIRLSELDNYRPNSNSQLLLRTAQRGPQTDFNALIFPNGKKSFLVGANDTGTPQTSWNAAVKQNVTPSLALGGGVLYNNLGALVQYNPGRLGVEARLYDLRFPTLDAYGNFNVAHGVQVFGGERDITHSGRRTVFGLQLQF